MEHEADDRKPRDGRQARDPRLQAAAGTESTITSFPTSASWPLVGLSIHVVLVAAFLVRVGGNPQYFVHFGEAVAPFASEVLGADVLVPHVDGHDGKEFWLLARDPLLLHAKDILAPNLDRPAYRAQRIGYPLLAAPWRLGGETALLWGLLVTNLAVVLAGGLVAAALARSFGAAPRASLAFALSPGVLQATLFSLSDALALALLLGTALALARRRHGVAVTCGLLGALTKEATLLGLAGFALLAPRLPIRTRALLLAAPAAAAGAWALYVRWRLGEQGPQIRVLELPFWGYADAWRRGWSRAGNWSDAVIALAFVPIAVLGIHRWRTRRTLLLAGGVPFLALVPFLSAEVIDLAGHSLRVLTPSLTLMVLDYYAELGGDRAGLGASDG